MFVVVRAELVPKDFGKLGHYRPGAIDDIRARPVSYAGRARCMECHEDVFTTMAPARHKNLGCEGCHGPLFKHADDPEVAPVKLDGYAYCMRCHAAKTGKPIAYPTIDLVDHMEKGDTCASCHKPHDPRIEESEPDAK
jgi:hypothetical protein